MNNCKSLISDLVQVVKSRTDFLDIKTRDQLRQHLFSSNELEDQANHSGLEPFIFVSNGNNQSQYTGLSCHLQGKIEVSGVVLLSCIQGLHTVDVKEFEVL